MAVIATILGRGPLGRRRTISRVADSPSLTGTCTSSTMHGCPVNAAVPHDPTFGPMLIPWIVSQ